MYGDIEDLVLSGRLFNPPSRSSSPVRSRSPSPGPAPWPTKDGDFDYDSDAERRATVEAHIASQQQQESIGMGPGRTGVKGVIRDRAEAESLARAKRADEIKELNRAMEKASLGGQTWAEEEKERLAKIAAQESLTAPSSSRAARSGRYGHLREVGVRSFVQAVEEDRNVWVVVHIYDPSLDRCAAVDETLSRLARAYPSTKFLRARAGAIGFASSGGSRANLGQPSSLSRSRFSTRGLVTRPPRIQERDEFFDDDVEDEKDGGDDDDDDDAPDEQWEDDEVDTDVLPTLLVYRGGELVHSWVRVDWEAKQGIEELLKRHNILSSPRHFSGATGSHSLEEDDLSDDGEELVFGNSDDER
ncbi:thioredoxin-like protein [Lentinus tigrinus ALCF2SS1-7]|uniref:Thioredoxin-like protein n=1 Tax=Lentinus tigrinus ALCF2SS1-6 TaxID=1328759 RepID=A0A5C2S533_9APHY|nr:thioredoxin-like protein [Lentinus tigrinus ALCF2SS1-6]RPD69831.1 thioredoxin-like protein [Lentinus tigrinus ALCF2SS1-7]